MLVFVPACFSGALSCPFDLLAILNAFSRFPAYAHAHSFQTLRISLTHWGLCSFHPLFQLGNFIPMFVPSSISIARLFIFISVVLSIITHLLSFRRSKVAFGALLAGLPRLNRFHARMSHRRPLSCSKSATWSPS